MKSPLCPLLFLAGLVLPGLAQEGERTLLLALEGNAMGLAVGRVWVRAQAWRAPRLEAEPEAWVELHGVRGGVLVRVPLDLSVFNLDRGEALGRVLVAGDQVRDPRVAALVKVPDLGVDLAGMRIVRRLADREELLGSATAAELRLLAGGAGPALAPAVKTHLASGPVANRYDIVVLGDGYQLAEMGRFHQDVDGWLGNLFGREPFRSYKGFFNVHSVFRESAESGATHPDANPPIYKNTAYGASYNTGGTARCLYIRNTGLALQDAALAPDVEGRVVVFVNDSRYGGCAGQFAVSYNGSSAGEVQSHEFGHAFGGLADEYVSYSSAYTGSEPGQANITKDPTGKAKWPLWLGFNGVGAFEGAGYYAKGLFRPKQDCLMRSLGAPLCEVCVEQLLKSGYGTVDPIEDAVPAAGNAALFSFSPPLIVAFRDLVPGGGKVAWYLDGALKQTGGTSFHVSLAALGAGTYKLRLEVADDSAMVRSDPKGLLRRFREWTLSLREGEGVTPFYTYDSNNPGDGMGTALAGAGDVDGDGFADVLLGAPGAGEAWVVSGASGRRLRTIAGAAADEPGAALAGPGDLDRDGRADLAVGAPGAQGGKGEARAFSGRDGKALFVWIGKAAGDRFGAALAPAGDANKDGWPDLIVGAPGGKGEARVLSGRDGMVLHAWTGAAAGDGLGAAVAGAGDADQDGWPDLLVGAPMAQGGKGEVQLRSGKDGGLLRSWTGAAAGDRLGAAVAGPGDLDRDGFADLAAGAPGVQGGKGEVRVFSGKDGRLLFALLGEAAGDGLGEALAAAGDADNDGRPDLLAGAPGGWGRGVVRLHAGGDGRLLHLLPGPAPGARFGQAVAGPGDLNGDGLPELGAGGPAAGGGVARLFSWGLANLAMPTSLSLALGGAQTFFINLGPAHAGKAYLVLGSMSGTAPGFALGAVRVPLAVDSYTTLSILMANGPICPGFFGQVPGTGLLLPSLRLAAGLDPALAGAQLHHAAVVLGGDGLLHLATNAEPLRLRP